MNDLFDNGYWEPTDPAIVFLLIWLGGMALSVSPQRSVRIGGACIALGCILGAYGCLGAGYLLPVVLGVLTVIVLFTRPIIMRAWRQLRAELAAEKESEEQ
ncbi:MAG: hypothetical protein ACYS8X_11090 [Planctomycetota bacterium]|jgi:hypothetical protein